MRRVSSRAAALSAAILGVFTAIFALLWSRPAVLLWVLIGLIVVLAYCALYLIIAGARHRDTAHGEAPTVTGPHQRPDTREPARERSPEGSKRDSA
jgi:hypothetical protein